MTSVTNPIRGPGQADQDPDLEADIDVMYFFNVNGLMTVTDRMYVITIKADRGLDHQFEVPKCVHSVLRHSFKSS